MISHALFRTHLLFYLDTREYLKEVGAAPEFVSDYREISKEKWQDATGLIDEFKDIQHLLAAMESACDFARGFRFGAKFILDVLGKDESK